MFAAKPIEVEPAPTTTMPPSTAVDCEGMHQPAPVPVGETRAALLLALNASKTQSSPQISDPVAHGHHARRSRQRTEYESPGGRVVRHEVIGWSGRR